MAPFERKPNVPQKGGGHFNDLLGNKIIFKLCFVRLIVKCACVSGCACTCVCVCACACKCVRETETEKERDLWLVVMLKQTHAHKNKNFVEKYFLQEPFNFCNCQPILCRLHSFASKLNEGIFKRVIKVVNNFNSECKDLNRDRSCNESSPIDWNKHKIGFGVDSKSNWFQKLLIYERLL